MMGCEGWLVMGVLVLIVCLVAMFKLSPEISGPLNRIRSIDRGIVNIDPIQQGSVVEKKLGCTFGIILLCVSLVGCSSLVLREDDTTRQSMAKISTRVFLAPLTLFLSEYYIGKLQRTANRTEQRAKQQAEQAVRFGEMCEIEGYTPGTPEHRRCLSGKQDQVERISSGGSGGSDEDEQKFNRICARINRPKWCP